MTKTNPSVVAQLGAATADLALLTNDPVAAVDEVLEVDPLNPRALAFRSYLDCYGQTSESLASARSRLASAEGPLLADSANESLHLEAASHWSQGRIDEAISCLEWALVEDPRDLLALKISQDLAFFVGDHRQLRDLVARVLPAWDEGDRQWGLIRGMYAFGLEEMGEYRRAEVAARQALQACRQDVWAAHALAHVLEMEGRHAEGARFLDESSTDWGPSYFAVHNWWHLALFLIELGDIDGAIGLYDQRVGSGDSEIWLDLVDSASLLWRLSLLGIDVSERAVRALGPFEERIDDSIYVFNDLHSVCIFALAGRPDLTARLLEGRQAPSVGTNEKVLAGPGRRMLTAFSDFAGGDYSRATEGLAAALPTAYQIGGSHAQRDLINQTMLVAAARAGNKSLLRALVSERGERQHWTDESISRLASST